MLIPISDENPTKKFPIMTILIIIANVAVFIYEISLGLQLEGFFYRFSVIPYEITNGVNIYQFPGEVNPIYLSVFSSMFLHGNLIHLLSNMLYLWIFGNNIEDYLGSFKFIIFYLICGLGGTFAHILSDPFSKIPSLGASGAIAGILGAYILLYPRAKINSLVIFFYFIRIISLPASLVIGFWIFLQVISGLQEFSVSPESGSGVAWFAHIGGFVTGLALILIFKFLKNRSKEYIRE